MLALKLPVGFKVADIFCCVIAAGVRVVETTLEVINNELGSLDVVLLIVEINSGPVRSVETWYMEAH